MDSNKLEIQVEDAAGPDAQRLIQAFAQELAERYGDEGPVIFSPDELKGLGRAFLDQNFDDIRRVVDTNVTGTLYLIHKIGRDMRARNQ